MLTFTLTPFVLPVLALTGLAVAALLGAALAGAVVAAPIPQTRRWRRSPIARQALPSLLGPAMASRKGHVAALGFSSIEFDPAAPARPGTGEAR